MSIFRNRQELLSHGNIADREQALDILETGLVAGDPYDNVVECVRIEGNRLIVGNERFHHQPLTTSLMPDRPRPWPNEPLVYDLDEVDNIYVVGGGKAAQRMGEALEDILGDRIAGGHICAKKGDTVRLKRIGVTLAGHPIPDAESVSGSKKIIEIENSATERDIVILSMSGGGTALMTCPAEGITLEDIQAVNRVLYFEHGAPMPVANAVRGLLATLRLKHSRHVGDATFIELVTTEQPLPEVDGSRMWPPPGKDDYDYAIELIHEYDCWDEIPESVRQFLLRADPAYTLCKPSEWWDKPHFMFRVMGPETMLDAALARAKALGLNAEILVSSMASLDARTIGEMSGYLARETVDHKRPLEAPCAWIFGGELVVPTGQTHGIGGRNQEFALGAALHIGGYDQVVIASADSDGRDGPSQHAGAIVDGQTLARAEALGLDVMDVLHRHDTDPAFAALGDAIETGVLNTNVQDLRVILVSDEQQA